MVIAMTLALVATTTAILSNARSSAATANAMAERARTTALADGAVMSALAYMRARRPVPAEIDGIGLEMTDLGLRVPINSASLPQLRQTFLVTGRREAETWLDRIAQRRADFAALGIRWQIDSRPIKTAADLAGFLGVAPDDPVLEQFNTFPPETGQPPPVRIRALSADGQVLREATAIVGVSIHILDWR
jgi:hypothetical protein